MAKVRKTTLDDILTIGRDHWGFDLPLAALQDSLSESVLDGDARELYLAAGCQIGVPRALQFFDTHYLSKTVPLLARAGFAQDIIDESLQTLRERLLVVRPNTATIPLLRYAGTGNLLSLVRVSASRRAIQLSRQRDKATGNDSLSEILTTRDAERLLSDRQQHQVFKQCFAHAISSGTDADRVLLKLHLVDELAYEEIAKIFAVNRSTICRRLRAARGNLLKRIEIAWTEVTGNPMNADIAALLDGQLDLSLSRLL